MNNDEIAARLLILEEFATAGVIGHAMMAAMSGGVPAAIDYLSQVRLGAQNSLRKLSPDARLVGEKILDDLLSRVSEAFEGLPPSSRPDE